MVDLRFKDSEPRFPVLQPWADFHYHSKWREHGCQLLTGDPMAGIPVLLYFSVFALISHRREGDKAEESGLQWLGDPWPVSLLQGTCARPRDSWQFHVHQIAFLGFWGGAGMGSGVGAALCCPQPVGGRCRVRPGLLRA